MLEQNQIRQKRFYRKFFVYFFSKINTTQTQVFSIIIHFVILKQCFVVDYFSMEGEWIFDKNCWAFSEMSFVKHFLQKFNKQIFRMHLSETFFIHFQFISLLLQRKIAYKILQSVAIKSYRILYIYIKYNIILQTHNIQLSTG